MTSFAPVFDQFSVQRTLAASPFLPLTRDELNDRGWDNCDVVIVTGDAYVDHPSFGAALIGRVLEAHGFRVGIIAQPDWTNVEAFKKLGRPRLFFGVTAGNMDSMVNRYTSEKRLRHNDAYTPRGEGGKRPDRAAIVYAQRCREAYRDVPIVLGGIEASLRRLAHFDYWSEKVRRSILLDARADLLLYGNAERAVVEVACHLAAQKSIDEIDGLRGSGKVVGEVRNNRSAVQLPSYEQVRADPQALAVATRLSYQESNPHNARALAQTHGSRTVWLEPPALPLSTEEMDRVYALPYARRPHPFYKNARIPAYETTRFSVSICRGCFGGCSFCAIGLHEGAIVQSRSRASVLREIEEIAQKTPDFRMVISDLGGPTANTFGLGCNDFAKQKSCRKPSCLYPRICKNLRTSHKELIELYRAARALPQVRKVFVASGIRHDLALCDPEYIRELATHHVGGLLKTAPEHVAKGPLAVMHKPPIELHERFAAQFSKASREAGKKQEIVPYLIAAHPGTTDEDMLELALWLQRHKIKVDKVQTFLPVPMTLATAVYCSGKNSRGKEVVVPQGARVRRLHKAFARYHDPENAALLQRALTKMGRRDLIGTGPKKLIRNSKGGK